MRALPALLATLAAISAAGCAPAPGTPAADGTPSAGAERPLVPAGFGTLRQDDATMSLRAGPLQVKLTPLDEATIRLLAPDSYTRLRALRDARRDDAMRAARTPELFLVAFFGSEPDVAFHPEDVQLLHRARLLRAAAIMPVTAGWGRQQLGQQETQLAVYVFDGPIDYRQSLVVRYGTVENDEWRHMVTRLEIERARLLTRVR
jgi:hypothetical protein